MSGLRGFAAGVVGLSLLEVITSNQHGEAGRVGDVFDGAASILAWWLNPYRPLVPDLTGGNPNPFGLQPDSKNRIYLPSPKKDPEKRPPGKGGRIPGNPDGPGIRPGPGGIGS